MPKKQSGGNLMSFAPSAFNQDYINQLHPTCMKDNIYVDTQTSPGWHMQNDSTKTYAVDINAGYNDYMFSRTTPDNKFITTTGLELNKKTDSFELVGGGKKKVKSDKNKEKELKKKEFKKVLKNSFFKMFDKIKEGVKKIKNTVVSSKSKTKETSKPKKDSAKPKTKETPKPKKDSAKPKTKPKKDSSKDKKIK
jgi:hypothetical protein